MDIIEKLKEEHLKIRTILLNLEMHSRKGSVDTDGILFNLKSLYDIWDKHEEKEEDIFPYLEKRGINVPVQELRFEHGALRRHRERIRAALISGAALKIEEIINLDLNIVIAKIREHMNKEDSVLYGVSWESLKEKDLDEVKRIVERG
ncbi:hemerythrin domain-containing protein [Candidatus Pacearchaeota archaeon]|nr:hemerythrin domain-containing protein [Candidatus Pacearchaeota archaeon]